MAGVFGLREVGDGGGLGKVVGLEHFGVHEECAADAENRSVVGDGGTDRVELDAEVAEELLALLHGFEVVGADRHHVGFDVLPFGDELAAEFGRAEALHEVGALETVLVEGVLHRLLRFFVGVGVDDDGRRLGGFGRGLLGGLGRAAAAVAANEETGAQDRSEEKRSREFHDVSFRLGK